MQQCETINLGCENPTWKALPEMNEGRCGFNPSLYQGYVYVCGFPSYLVEAFSPHTDSFLSLQLRLPDKSYYCLYVNNNTLVMHSRSYIIQFSTGTAGQLTPHSQACCFVPKYKWSNSQPVLDQSRSLFFLIQEDTCYRFNMETGVQSN